MAFRSNKARHRLFPSPVRTVRCAWKIYELRNPHPENLCAVLRSQGMLNGETGLVGATRWREGGKSRSAWPDTRTLKRPHFMTGATMTSAWGKCLADLFRTWKTPLARRTIARIAALASSVVASTPTVLPFSTNHGPPTRPAATGKPGGAFPHR